MKKLRTSGVKIVIHSEKERRFVVPQAKLRPVLTLLKTYESDISDENADSIPWELLAKGRISKFSKPGLALRGARVKEGMTQVELAAKLGIPQYNLSKMENGSRAIGKKMAVRLSKALRIDYRVFL